MSVDPIPFNLSADSQQEGVIPFKTNLSKKRKLKPPKIEVQTSHDFFRQMVKAYFYPIGKENFSRCFQGTSFPVQIELNSQVDLNYDFFLSISTQHHPKTYQDLPFQKEGHFLKIDLTTQVPGVMRFRLKVVDRNGQVFIDQLNPGYLFVDPISIKNLRMYTLIPAQAGSFKQWIEWLYLIKEMGFNAIHLLPFQKMGKSQSPYAAQSFSEIDPQFANPGDGRPLLEQFEEFVDHANRLEIKICLDFVLNHTAVDSEIGLKRPDWLFLDPQSPGGFRHAGCWHDGSWMEWKDLYLINYQVESERSKHLLWNYMTKVALFWAQYADIVRLDNLHSSHLPFIQHVLRRIRLRQPDLIVLAEYFSNHNELKEVVIGLGLNLVLATTWGTKFVPELSGYLRYINQCYPQISYFGMPLSHDADSVLQEFKHAKYALLRYFVTAFLTSPYLGMVQGYEYILDQKLKFIAVESGQRIDFTQCQHDISHKIQRFNQLKEEHPVLNQACDWIENTHSVIAGYKSLNQKKALILINMNIDQAETISVSFAHSLEFKKIVGLTQAPLHVGPGVQTLTLLPGEMVVYLSE